MKRSFSQGRDIDWFSLSLWYVVVIGELFVISVGVCKAGLMIYFPSRIYAWQLALMTCICDTKLAWDQDEQ